MKTRKAYRGEDGVWRLQLTRGYETLLDEEDALWAEQWLWSVVEAKAHWSRYAKRNVPVAGGKQTSLQLHTAIAKRAGLLGREIDHVSTDGLDNRRQNLRAAERHQNVWNTGKNALNTSGFKGVCFDPESGKWRARITVKNKRTHLGRFSSAEAAGTAYEEAALELHGEFARL